MSIDGIDSSNRNSTYTPHVENSDSSGGVIDLGDRPPTTTDCVIEGINDSIDQFCIIL